MLLAFPPLSVLVYVPDLPCSGDGLCSLCVAHNYDMAAPRSFCPRCVYPKCWCAATAHLPPWLPRTYPAARVPDVHAHTLTRTMATCRTMHTFHNAPTKCKLESIGLAEKNPAHMKTYGT